MTRRRVFASNLVSCIFLRILSPVGCWMSVPRLSCVDAVRQSCVSVVVVVSCWHVSVVGC